MSRIEGDPAPGDTTTDDHEVEPVLGHASQMCLTLRRVEAGRG